MNIDRYLDADEDSDDVVDLNNISQEEELERQRALRGEDEFEDEEPPVLIKPKKSLGVKKKRFNRILESPEEAPAVTKQKPAVAELTSNLSKKTKKLQVAAEPVATAKKAPSKEAAALEAAAAALTGLPQTVPAAVSKPFVPPATAPSSVKSAAPASIAASVAAQTPAVAISAPRAKVYPQQQTKPSTTTAVAMTPVMSKVKAVLPVSASTATAAVSSSISVTAKSSTSVASAAGVTATVSARATTTPSVAVESAEQVQGAIADLFDLGIESFMPSQQDMNRIYASTLGSVAAITTPVVSAAAAQSSHQSLKQSSESSVDAFDLGIADDDLASLPMAVMSTMAPTPASASLVGTPAAASAPQHQHHQQELYRSAATPIQSTPMASSVPQTQLSTVTAGEPRPTMVIATRSISSQISSQLRTARIRVNMVRLPHGDYVLSARSVALKRTAAELAAVSAESPALLETIRFLQMQYERVFVIVEAGPAGNSQYARNKGYFTGLTTLVREDKVRVVYCEYAEQVTQFMLATMHEDMQAGHGLMLCADITTQHDQVLFLLQLLSGSSKIGIAFLVDVSNVEYGDSN
eukprot:TRINITY_DN6968_c0_g1_i2.p1 TRINITY_DN6968_c0_g1~~TRINITY_DN6968_c0_g1_i2.p1  ORF type:complete len:598 (-),score=179.72 TRINITY_DN6968_c0_g1_i2:146-1888(-)